MHQRRYKKKREAPSFFLAGLGLIFNRTGKINTIYRHRLSGGLPHILRSIRTYSYLAYEAPTRGGRWRVESKRAF